MYPQEWRLDHRLVRLAEKIQKLIEKRARDYRKLAAFNQARILHAFQTEQVTEADFHPSYGYGFGDEGRNKLDRIWARVFEAEAALVRHQIASGTHALSLCLFGVLRPGDQLLAVTGKPYDTLEPVIGSEGSCPGSLTELGVGYREIPLTENGVPDMAAIEEAVSKKTRLVLIQRSRGYSWRPALSPALMKKIIALVKRKNPHTICLVDNCYGEFVSDREPTALGADLAAGSLIKNPGGGLVPAGGYVVGKSELVEMAAGRLTAPGLGSAGGATLDTKRLFYQGLFLAPHVVAEALTGALFIARFLEELGFTVSPGSGEERHDIIQAVQMKNREQLIGFCQGVQKASPVDSMAIPEPAPMPGYAHDVIMACGSFIQGASIELSADAPLREPYIAYIQGGLTAFHVQAALLLTLQYMVENEMLVIP